MARPCLALDLSRHNPALQGFDPADPTAFGGWLEARLAAANCAWAAGGYAEDRAVYAMSPLFAGAGGQRSIHLGVDLWMPAGTPVHAVLPGRIHSLADNARPGDYGPTVIVEHTLAEPARYALYGHLSRATLSELAVGQPLAAGQRFAALGTPAENLGWPPHLHLQLIRDIGTHRGDYPGVCLAAEAAQWLQNCPDPTGLIKAWYQPR